MKPSHFSDHNSLPKYCGSFLRLAGAWTLLQAALPAANPAGREKPRETSSNVSVGQEIVTQEGRRPGVNLLDQREQEAAFWVDEGRGQGRGLGAVPSCLGLRLLISKEGRMGPAP